MIDEIKSQVEERYTVLKQIDRGSTCTIWEAIDKKYDRKVAIKQIDGAFSSIADASRTYREITFLQGLAGHENVIILRNIIDSTNHKDLYLVFEHVEANLHGAIRHKLLEDIHKQYIIYQILKILKYIHSAELIHNGLKPSIFLINYECQLKIIKFDCILSTAQTKDYEMPNYDHGWPVKYHKPPEVLLVSEKRSKAVDMWAVGCILGELILGKPVFRGNSTLNQIERIIELLGRPSPEDIEALSSPYTSGILSAINTTQKYAVEDFFSEASDDARDLLKKLLVYNPYERLTVEEALNHKYLEQFASEDEEIVCDHAIELELGVETNWSISDYQKAVYGKMHKLNSPPIKSKKGAEKPKEKERS